MTIFQARDVVELGDQIDAQAHRRARVREAAAQRVADHVGQDVLEVGDLDLDQNGDEPFPLVGALPEHDRDVGPAEFADPLAERLKRQTRGLSCQAKFVGNGDHRISV